MYDDDFILAKQKGTKYFVAQIAKTIAAFACLQYATHKRTANQMDLKIIYKKINKN